LILGNNLFAGIYAGGAHPLGLIQALASLGGYDGICIVHPPPNARGSIGPPFKLYYGYGGHAWCVLLALHVVFMCLVGWYFLFITFKDRQVAKQAGRKWWLLDDPPVSILYGRLGLFLTVGGLSQAAPYFGVLGESWTGDMLLSTGGYSKRMFSPGLTENLSAWSWIIGGLFFACKWMMGGSTSSGTRTKVAAEA